MSRFQPRPKQEGRKHKKRKEQKGRWFGSLETLKTGLCRDVVARRPFVPQVPSHMGFAAPPFTMQMIHDWSIDARDGKLPCLKTLQRCTFDEHNTYTT